jgi:hypothetical protein
VRTEVLLHADHARHPRIGRQGRAARRLIPTMKNK